MTKIICILLTNTLITKKGCLKMSFQIYLSGGKGYITTSKVVFHGFDSMPDMLIFYIIY